MNDIDKSFMEAMTRPLTEKEKRIIKILEGKNDDDISFLALQEFLDDLKFKCYIKGDHFIYTKDGISEILNIQPNGDKAKVYQVKQVRNIGKKINKFWGAGYK